MKTFESPFSFDFQTFRNIRFGILKEVAPKKAVMKTENMEVEVDVLTLSMKKESYVEYSYRIEGNTLKETIKLTGLEQARNYLPTFYLESEIQGDNLMLFPQVMMDFFGIEHVGFLGSILTKEEGEAYLKDALLKTDLDVFKELVTDMKTRHSVKVKALEEGRYVICVDWGMCFTRERLSLVQAKMKQKKSLCEKIRQAIESHREIEEKVAVNS